MRPEAEPWLAKAEENFKTAEFLFVGQFYAAACFHCQQALETLLKAAIIELAGKRHPKIHELDRLYAEANLPDFAKHKKALVSIGQHYSQVRYPDVMLSSTRYTQRVSEKSLRETKKIFLWLKNQITKK